MKPYEIITFSIAVILIIGALIITEHNKTLRTEQIIEACELGEKPWETNTLNISEPYLLNNGNYSDAKNDLPSSKNPSSYSNERTEQ